MRRRWEIQKGNSKSLTDAFKTAAEAKKESMRKADVGAAQEA